MNTKTTTATKNVKLSQPVGTREGTRLPGEFQVRYLRAVLVDGVVVGACYQAAARAPWTLLDNAGNVVSTFRTQADVRGFFLTA